VIWPPPAAALKVRLPFANTAGGAVLIAVRDRARRWRGVRDPLELDERVANVMSDRIAPRVMPRIEIAPWMRTQALALPIHPRPRLADQQGH
jgi:hypothetical protein